MRNSIKFLGTEKENFGSTSASLLNVTILLALSVDTLRRHTAKLAECRRSAVQSAYRYQWDGAMTAHASVVHKPAQTP